MTHLAVFLRHYLSVWGLFSKEAFTIDEDSEAVKKIQLASTRHKLVKLFKGLVKKKKKILLLRQRKNEAWNSNLLESPRIVSVIFEAYCA